MAVVNWLHKNKIKILQLLSERPHNVYQLHLALNISYSTCLKHIAHLEKELFVKGDYEVIGKRNCFVLPIGQILIR